MLRAKAVRARTAGFTLREAPTRRHRCSRAGSPDSGGSGAGERGQSQRRPAARCWKRLSASTVRRPLPQYHARSARQRLRHLGTTQRAAGVHGTPQRAGDGGDHRAGGPVHELLWQPQRAGARRGPWSRCSRTTASKSRCCAGALFVGCRGFELGDLEAVARLKEYNIPQLAQAVDAGYDLVAPIPSCVLMFKQELPLMYPRNAQVRQVAARMFDPFEYLMLRHEAGRCAPTFKAPLGKVSYPRALSPAGAEHRAQTRDLLKLVPGTSLDTIERCSGHNGTYGVKREFRAASVRIGRPVVQRVENAQADHYASDCPMAAQQIASGLTQPRAPSIRCGCCGSRTDCRRSSDMDKLAATDLMPLEQYARERPAFRARVLRHRPSGSSAVGRTSPGWFEDRLHGAVPGAGDAAHRAYLRARAIADELGAYNPLIPDAALEGDAVDRVYAPPSGRVRSRALKGIEDRCWVEVPSSSAMARASKIRSVRSISCTWYCTVSRSSNNQVTFGPTASCRSALWRSNPRAKGRPLAGVLLERHEVGWPRACPCRSSVYSPSRAAAAAADARGHAAA